MEYEANDESVAAVLRGDGPQPILTLWDEPLDQNLAPEYAEFCEQMGLHAHLQGKMCSSRTSVSLDVEELVGLVESLRELTGLRWNEARRFTQARSCRRDGMNEQRLDIVRMETMPEFGLHHWLLFGLNIFNYNDVPCLIEQRPDVLFLTAVTSRIGCSAHVGAMALKDRVDAPEEMFGPSQGDLPYLRTRTDYYDGFFDLGTSPCFDACFFPTVTPLFWQALLREEDVLGQMLFSHGFAFYVAPRSGTIVEMERLLAAPFPGEAHWLTAVTDLY